MRTSGFCSGWKDQQARKTLVSNINKVVANAATLLLLLHGFIFISANNSIISSYMVPRQFPSISYDWFSCMDILGKVDFKKVVKIQNVYESRQYFPLYFLVGIGEWRQYNNIKYEEYSQLQENYTHINT